MKRFLLFVLSSFLLNSLTLTAQAPTNYYQSAVGKKKEALKTALSSIINNAGNSGYDGLYTIYETSDIREDGKVWDMYSNITNYTFKQNCGNYSVEGDCFNREHSVPQSWFSKKSPMVSDAWHVVPTDGKINGMRSNFPLGEVGTITNSSANGFSKLGKSKTPGYSSTVFEPNDLYKGDFARMYFYMATRYQSQVGSWTEGVFSSSYPHLVKWTLDLMLKWHRQDPVSQKEIVRNNAIYNSTQRNRNPYVDYPDLVELVFGNRQTEAFDPDNMTPGEPENPDVPAFELLEPTNITDKSFTVNWVAQDKAEDYKLEVYTFEESGIEQENIFDLNITAAATLSAWKKEGFAAFEAPGGFRLGSGSSDGSITSPTLNKSDSYELIVKWAPYKTDKSTLYVYAGSQLIKSLTLKESSPQIDTVYFSLSSDNPIKLMAKANLRVYLNSIVLNSGMPAQEIAVEGYPRNTGNVTSYKVDGLKELTDYYYQLTPIVNGVATSTSKEKKVTTSISNALEETYEADQVISYISDGNLYLQNAPYHARICIYDVTGKLVKAYRAIQKEETFVLPSKGIYLLEITHPSVHITRKLYFQ